MPRVTRDEAELSIFERFKTAYEKEFGSLLVDVEHNDRPDFTATDPHSGKRLGIEVTGVYQDKAEARIQYWDVENWVRFEGSLDDFVSSMNKVLSDKAEKSWEYDFDGKLILSIWLGSLVFTEKTDIGFIRNEINIPHNTFSDIWLIIRNLTDFSPELYPLQIGGFSGR